MKREKDEGLQFVVNDVSPWPTGHPISINGIYQLSVLQHASTDTERAKRHEHTYTNSLPPSHTNIHHVVEEGWHLLPLTTFLSFSRAHSSQTLSTSLLSRCALISSHLSYSGASLPPVKNTEQGTNCEGQWFYSPLGQLLRPALCPSCLLFVRSAMRTSCQAVCQINNNNHANAHIQYATYAHILA